MALSDSSTLRKVAVFVAALLGVTLLVAVPGAPKAQAAPSGLPAGFAVTSQPSGQAAYDLTDFAYLPDGSYLTTGKSGKVAWVSADGTRTRTLATLPVTTIQDLGLVGVAVAPDYATSKAIYLARTMPGSTNNWPMRLSRFTVTGSPEPTGIGSEVTLLQTPATSDVHAITGIEPAADGTLWVSVGDAADFRVMDPAALRSLDVNDPRGKVLHVKGTDGTGVAGNPFYESANPGSTRSKVFAMGFRSPLRLSIHPASGAPILGDVGWNTFEEVDLVRAGASYGWPCFEANSLTPGYRDLAGCAGKTNTAPLHFYDRPSGNGSSVTGGVVYTGTSYPAVYQGAYFFGDYTSGKVWTMQVSAAGTVTRAPEAGGFGNGMGGPVSFDTGPNGDIVYADISDATLKRIVYAAGNRPPTAIASTTTNPQTRTVTFDGTGSYDLDGDTLTYGWNFGDGSTGTGATATKTYPAGTGTLTATLTVTDQLGKRGTTSFTVAPTNNAPALTLTAPPATTVYKVGDTVSLSASATDVEDGANLPVSWTTTAVHCRDDVCHDHPGLQVNGPTYSTPFDDHGDDTELVITAAVTDSVGVVSKKTFTANPDLRMLTVKTSVPAPVTINGVVRDSALVTVGAKVSVSVPATATDGVSTFQSWSNGQARAHDVTATASPITITATYAGPIDQRYSSDAAMRAAVGTASGTETGDAAIRWKDYTGGRAYWTAETGVKFVAGAIRTKFMAMGAHTGVGVPTTDELGTPVGGGRYNQFTNDKAIYWTSGTGARVVAGRIKFRWGTFANEQGFLKFPTTDELVTPDGIGRFNHFQGGSIYWSPATDAWEVHGLIKDRWAKVGWEAGPLGYPTTNELGTPDGRGRFNHFAKGGSVYWTPTTGAWDVYGAIRTRWAALGWERSYLGYPTSGEFAISGGRRTNFERGYITWNARTGQVIDRRY